MQNEPNRAAPDGGTSPMESGATDAQRRGFDRLARSYDFAARLIFGDAIRTSQSCFLSRLPSAADVLVVGGGSGWFLQRLLEEADCRSVVYVDLSPRMLALAEETIRSRRPEDLPKIRFVPGTPETIPPGSSFDVIVTHCFLDLFADDHLRSVVSRLKRHLRPTGIWYFSDFRHAEGTLSAPLSRGLVAAMYSFFRITCRIDARHLPRFGDAFREAGLVTVEEARFFRGMLEARLICPAAGYRGRLASGRHAGGVQLEGSSK